MTLGFPANQINAPAYLFRWLVAVDDTVQQGQPIAIVVNDDAEWAIAATASGIVSQMMVNAGSLIDPQQPLVMMQSTNESVAAPLTQSIQTPRSTPVARAIALQHALDLATISGSGRGGRIHKRDVLALLNPTQDRPVEGGFCVAEQMGNTLHADDQVIRVASPKASAKPTQPIVSAFNAEQNIDSSRRTTVNDSVPHAIVSLHVDMSQIEHTVMQQHAAYARRGVTLTPTAALTTKLVQALRQHPALLRRWYADDEYVQSATIHLAVEYAESSVVLAHSADLNLQGVARALQQETANPSNPTFTFVHSAANWWSAPTLGADQAALLHVGATHKTVEVRTFGDQDQTVIVPCAIMTLVYDARLIDDRTAEDFLVTLQTLVEAP